MSHPESTAVHLSCIRSTLESTATLADFDWQEIMTASEMDQDDDEFYGFLTERYGKNGETLVAIA